MQKVYSDWLHRSVRGILLCLSWVISIQHEFKTSCIDAKYEAAMSSELLKPGPAMNIDQILTNVGEFGRFQILMEAIHCLLQIPYTLMILLPYFTQDSPAWMCSVNSTRCNETGPLPSTNKLRCKLPRSEWEYTLPKDYSVVTEVCISRMPAVFVWFYGKWKHDFLAGIYSD